MCMCVCVCVREREREREREGERERLFFSFRFSFFLKSISSLLACPKGYYLPAVALSPFAAVLPMEASIVAEAKSDEISAILVSSK